MIEAELLTSLKFFGRVSSMGPSKVVIYVPQAMHKDVMKNFKGKTIRVILEDAE
ncbi:MAG: hypothetical protein WA421_15100 [Nitrososphaeraceae archaeon]|jgi:hypothetical protein